MNPRTEFLASPGKQWAAYLPTTSTTLRSVSATWRLMLINSVRSSSVFAGITAFVVSILRVVYVRKGEERVQQRKTYVTPTALATPFFTETPSRAR